MPTQAEIDAAAAAIANARGGRHGALPIANVLDLLPEDLKRAVREDAQAALEAAEAVRNARAASFEER